MDTSTLWNVAGASWRGTSHKRSATPCQDAFAWERVGDEWLILSVADGAGSAPLSDIGSRVAVRSAVAAAHTELAQNAALVPALSDATLWGDSLRRVAAVARDTVVRVADSMGRKPRELASTLIVVVAGPCSTTAIQIGDGGSVIETPNGEVEPLTPPETGEYMGETTFLTSRDALDRTRLTIAGACDSLALFTDGLQLVALKYPTWEPFVPFFRSTFDFMREHGAVPGAAGRVEEFLASERLAARTDDDLTLLLARRRTATVVPSPLESRTTVASDAPAEVFA